MLIIDVVEYYGRQAGGVERVSDHLRRGAGDRLNYTREDVDRGRSARQQGQRQR